MEVLVALTILSVGIIGVFGAFSLSLRAGVRGERLAAAADIAEQNMEMAVAALGDYPESGAARGRYKWKLSVVEAAKGIKRARIEVEWTDRGKPAVFRLVRLFVVPEEPQE